MRPKRRYLLSYYSGNDNASDAIRVKYAERFGLADLEKASLEVISYKDGFLTLRFNLERYEHLLQAINSIDGNFVTLNVSGTLKALRSRQDEIKKYFMSGNRY